MFNRIDHGNKTPKTTRTRRFFNAMTGEYLHQSGVKTTKDVNQSWLGTVKHTERQRQIHADSGLLDGFAIIRREGMDEGEKVAA